MNYDDEFDNDDYLENDKKQKVYEKEAYLLKKFDDAIYKNNRQMVFDSLDNLFAYNILNEKIFLNYYEYKDSKEASEIERFFIRAFTSCVFKDHDKALLALYEYSQEKVYDLFYDFEKEFVAAGASKCLLLTNEYYPELLKIDEHDSSNSLLLEAFTMRSLSYDMKVEVVDAILEVYSTASSSYKIKEILDTYIYSHTKNKDNDYNLLYGMHNYNNVIALSLAGDGSKHNDLLQLIIKKCNKYNVKYDLNDNFYTNPLNDAKNINALEFFIKNGYDIKKYQYSFLSKLDFQWIHALYEKNILENTEENKNSIMEIFINQLNNVKLETYQFKELSKKLEVFSHMDYINLQHYNYNGSLAHTYVKLIVNYIDKSLKQNKNLEQYNNHISTQDILNFIKPIIESFEFLKEKGVNFEQVDMNTKKAIDYLKELTNSFKDYPSYMKRDLEAIEVPLEKLSFSLMLNNNKPSKKIKI